MQFTNNTHWRTSDIKRFLHALLDRVNVARSEVGSVLVEWQTRNASKATAKAGFDGDSIHIALYLPKKGPKNHHKNAMLAVACAAAQTTDAEVLAFQEVFRMANVLAFKLVDEWCHAGTVEDPDKILNAVGTTSKPDWAPIETFQIQKYKDPLKDGTYLDFVKKKQKAISRAEKDVERETERIAAAQRRLKLAEERKKKAQKALKDARSRRT